MDLLSWEDDSIFAQHGSELVNEVFFEAASGTTSLYFTTSTKTCQKYKYWLLYDLE